MSILGQSYFGTMHDLYSIQQGCPTFFLEGPFSDLGHRSRATYIIHIMKTEISKEDGKINIFNIITRKYVYKYTNFKALKKTKI